METKLRRGGAPKKEESERKEKIVRVLFNEAEHKRLKERKALTKSPNLSDFIRTVCLDKPLRMKPQLSTHQENVISLVREMRLDILRIGVNINQSSRRINSTTDYHDLQQDVKSMAEHVARWDEQLGTLLDQIEKGEQKPELATELTHGGPNQ